MTFWEWTTAWTRDPQFWAWITAWSRDTTVWEWVRTASAAIAGGFLGGFFTLRGQRRAERAQEKAQRSQFEESRDAATTEWERDRIANAWEKSLDSAHELFEKLTSLHRTIRATPIKKKEMAGGASWERWDAIWDDEVSLDLDIRSRLLADDPTRLAVQRIVWLIDRSTTLTAGYNPEAIKMSQKQLVEQLSSEAIEVVGSYIRRSPLNEQHKELVRTLEDAWRAYEAYEEWDIRRSIEMADQWAAEAGSSREEQDRARDEAVLAASQDGGTNPKPEK